MKQYLVPWVLWWLPLFGLWELLVRRLEVVESVLGLMAAGLAATAAVAVRTQNAVRYRPRPAWGRRLLPLPWRVVVDTVRVFHALWGQARNAREEKGGMRTIPFRCGGDDPESRARRALVTVGISLTPNAYVVDLIGDNSLMVHQLEPTRTPPGDGDAEWPL